LKNFQRGVIAFEHAGYFLQHFAQPAASAQHWAQVAASLQQLPLQVIAGLAQRPLLQLQVEQPVVIKRLAARTAASRVRVFMFVCFLRGRVR
jgi:hypothetical protein